MAVNDDLEKLNREFKNLFDITCNKLKVGFIADQLIKIVSKFKN